MRKGNVTMCQNHKPSVPFVRCNLVKYVDEDGVERAKGTPQGKYTVSTCNLKFQHPNHLHCSAKNCTAVSNLKPPMYKWRKHPTRRDLYAQDKKV